jgi:hypothetical protein
VPQTKKAPKEDPEAQAAREAEEAAQAEWLALVDRACEGDSPGARQVKRAIELEQEISVLRQRVADNRTYLRLMDRNGELTDDQGEFTDVFYAEKERGRERTEEESAATTRARKLAREANGNS